MFNTETNTPEGWHNLGTAMAIILAVNQKPSLAEFLDDFLDESYSACGQDLALQMRVRIFPARKDEHTERVNQSIRVSQEELKYASVDETAPNKPIWPVLVRKAVESFESTSASEMPHTLLMGNDGNPFGCVKKGRQGLFESNSGYENETWKRQYLCSISDWLTRLTGVRLRSTPILNADNVKQDTANIARIVNEAERGLAVVFDKWAPRYLIKTVTETPDSQKDPLQTEFEAVWLDIEKHGPSRRMDYGLKNFKTRNFTYGDIISGDEDRDVHLVYPYRQ